jgi:hypothetical protein
MRSLVVNSLHLVGALAGFWLIPLLARRFGASWLFFLVVGLGAAAMAAFVFVASQPYGVFEDFRLAYYEGGRAALEGGAAWSALYARGVDGFVNLPILAYLFAPFALFGPDAGAFLFFAAGVGAMVWSWRQLTTLFALSPEQSAIVLFAFACFGPLLYSFREGNISHLLLPLILQTLLDFRAKKELRAGALWGVIALVKPPLILLCVYLVLRMRWRAAGAALAMGLGVTLLSVAIFGLPLHLEWYEASIAPFAAGPIPGYNAQSIASMIARFETGVSGYRDWTPHILSSLGRGVVLAATALLVGAFGWIAWRKKADWDRVFETEIALLILLTCLVSTLAWSHYFVWAAPALILLWTGRKDARFGAWPLIAGFALLAPAVFLGYPLETGRLGPLSPFIVSHMTLGALVTYAALLRQRAEL